MGGPLHEAAVAQRFGGKRKTSQEQNQKKTDGTFFLEKARERRGYIGLSHRKKKTESPFPFCRFIRDSNSWTKRAPKGIIIPANMRHEAAASLAFGGGRPVGSSVLS